MAAIHSLSSPLKVGIAYQGGAALCARNAGMATAILGRPDLFTVEFITGTSAGGLNALKTTELLETGEDPRNGLRGMWHAMATYQKNVLRPLHYTAAAMGNHLASAVPLGLFHKVAMSLCRHADSSHSTEHHITNTYMEIANFFGHTLSTLNNSYLYLNRGKPLLDFLRRHYHLDFSAINRARATCTVNASRFTGHHSIWSLPARNEVLFSNKMEGGLDIRHALASGSLHHMMLPERIDGHDHHDGGYLANPNLTDIARKCAESGAILFVLRSRPTHAYNLREELHGTPEWASAFFNEKLDHDLHIIRREFPDLKICVIEPTSIERGLLNGLTPEMQFARVVVDRRFEEGEEIATATISKFLSAHYPHFAAAFTNSPVTPPARAPHRRPELATKAAH